MYVFALDRYLDLTLHRRSIVREGSLDIVVDSANNVKGERQSMQMDAGHFDVANHHHHVGCYCKQLSSHLHCVRACVCVCVCVYNACMHVLVYSWCVNISPGLQRFT